MRFVPFRVHKKIKGIDPDYNDFLEEVDSWYVYLNDENTTYLSFEQWETLYTADPEGWKLCVTRRNGEDCVACPVYFRVNEEVLREGDHPQFIKFLKRRDYRHWKSFLRAEFAKGIDLENTKEYQMLVSSAQRMADKRLSDAQKQIQAQYDDMMKLLEASGEKVTSTPKLPAIEVQKTFDFY